MFERFYWQSAKLEEIAAELELPVNTVKTRMRRGRKLLALAFAEQKLSLGESSTGGLAQSLPACSVERPTPRSEASRRAALR